MVGKTHSRSMQPSQVWDRTLNTAPAMHARTLRRDYVRTLSSMVPGVMQPVAAVPLLREDAVRSSMVRVAFDMAELSDMILNSVRVQVKAYVVPKLAFERFKGLQDLNEAYNKVDGAPAWFETLQFFKIDPINKALGLHAPEGQSVNTDYIEAYNAIWNFRARQRSASLTLRDAKDKSLAPAFWPATSYKHIKPSFDQAMIDGEVPLNLTDGGLVFGPNVIANVRNSANAGDVGVLNSTGQRRLIDTGTSRAQMTSETATNVLQAVLSGVTAELSEIGATVSLSNIDLARQTAAWARMRATYQGLDEDWMIDQLLSGIALPEQVMKQPMLVASAETIFGMAQRYSMSGDSLDKSVTRGKTMVDLMVRVPRLNTGGILMITAEITPEQIFERNADTYLECVDPALLPDRVRDELDPEPVSVVRNGWVDADHSLPDDVFGYAPLNFEWQRDLPRIGGKFYRNAGDAWTENRNRIWTPDVVDPTLGDNFYLAKDLTWEVFADTASDPFEVNASGSIMIDGLTYFGPALREATDDYDKIMAKVDMARIDQTATTAVDAKDRRKSARANRDIDDAEVTDDADA